MGGFIGFKHKDVFDKATVYNILFEGYITYGGMSGRDMNALAQGLYDGTEFEYLETRIKQVEYLGQLLKDAGIPVQYPFGGHAIFVDAKRFYLICQKKSLLHKPLPWSCMLKVACEGLRLVV